MRRRWIILSVSLSVVAGSLAGFTAVKLTQQHSSTAAFDYHTTGATDAHFTANEGTQGLLPDLTAAAEAGVEAVVYVENVRQVALRGYGSPLGGDDPFEFFFGPSQQPQQPQNQSPQTREQRSSGSGVILSEDGYIVTNNHVVEGADNLFVTLHDGAKYPATLVGTDPATDIALLKIEASGLRFMAFGDSDALRLGEWVLAVGNPYGLNSTVTAGIISAKGRSLGMGAQSQLNIESFIQTDAAVNAGNSGGALVTTNGLLVGINTIIKSPTGTFTGYSFAIPSSIVRKVVGDLREYGVVQRAMLGITYRSVTPEFIEELGREQGITQTGGVYIVEVDPEGAAKAAGIKPGDILTAIDGRPMNTTSDVQETIAKLRPNDRISATIKRAGEVKQIEVILRNRAGKTDLVSKEEIDLVRELGGTFREASEKQKKELKIQGGIQVVATSTDGLLARSRVQPGFIITAVNDRPISTVSDLNRITEKLQSIDGIYPDGRIVSYQTINR